MQATSESPNDTLPSPVAMDHHVLFDFLQTDGDHKEPPLAGAYAPDSQMHPV